MNKKTAALTTAQYEEIISTMKKGFTGCRPNERVATALVLEGNLGLRYVLDPESDTYMPYFYMRVVTSDGKNFCITVDV